MYEDQVMSELDLFGEMDRVADPVWEPAIDYTIVDRQATTVLHDSYSAGYCHLFKWEARRCGHMPELKSITPH